MTTAPTTAPTTGSTARPAAAAPGVAPAERATDRAQPAAAARPATPAANGHTWTREQAAEHYGIPWWGSGYFDVSPRGTVRALPERDPARAIDLFDLVSGLADREIYTPVLVRFTDMLGMRMRELRRAFDKAIAENEYRAGYLAVYPIKVNQQRTLLEEIVTFSRELGFGLEAGSKPELLAVLGLTSNAPENAPGGGGGFTISGEHPAERLSTLPIVCNGFKDAEYIETVILATKLGRDITPIVEGEHELDLIIRFAERYGVRPKIGLRVKPSSPGAGRWADSGGSKSKFGLNTSQVMRAVERLAEKGMLDCLRLIHFHIGSQQCDIRRLKNAVTEVAHTYCELRRLGCSGLDTINVGGGLAIDYDGSGSGQANSMNYSIEEYAADIVYRVKAGCDEAGMPHPRIMSESGRSMAAHASVLITDVLSASRFASDPDLTWIRATIDRERAAGQEIPQPLLDLIDAYESLQKPTSDPRTIYHDAMTARDESITLFRLGYVSLPLRSAAERLFGAIAERLVRAAERDEDLAAETGDLTSLVTDIYFCNFSLFQSLPDSWAIDQIFPIVPIHRLDDKPTRRAILADITCDSDGQIDRFGSPSGGPKTTIELHPLEPLDPLPTDKPADKHALLGLDHKPYYLGIFLVGAYQEVLGDLHNLFGDTHAVHVTVDADGRVTVDEFIEGDSVREVLSYVQFDVEQLKRAVRRDIELATKVGHLSVREGQQLMKFYETGLEGYTYLE